MKPDFEKGNGLLPAIIQDHRSNQVLMLGYMNHEAFEQTKKEGLVTFYSRSKDRLWTKGESSKNYLKVKSTIYYIQRIDYFYIKRSFTWCVINFSD